MTDYISPDQLRDYIGSETNNNQGVANAVCTVASRAIDGMANRYFYQDATVTTAYYWPDDFYCTQTDDISTTTGLIVATDDAADGTYSTVWTLNTDYFLEPVNQTQGGIRGWPYTQLTVTRSRYFYQRTPYYRRPLVKVTARFGWSAVPDAVTQATLVAAARLFKMKDAPDGFIGLAGWGPVMVRENPEVRALLGPYMRFPVVMA